MFFYLVWNNRVPNVFQDLHGSELLYSIICFIWFETTGFRKLRKNYNWAMGWTNTAGFASAVTSVDRFIC